VEGGVTKIPPADRFLELWSLRGEFIQAQRFVVKPVIVNDLPRRKLLISLWPYFAECQTFGPWKTIGLYAGLNGSFSLGLHCKNFPEEECVEWKR